MLTKLSDGTFVDPYCVSWVGMIQRHEPPTMYGYSERLSAIVDGYLLSWLDEDAQVFLAFIDEFAEKERLAEEKYQQREAEFRAAVAEGREKEFHIVETTGDVYSVEPA